MVTSNKRASQLPVYTQTVKRSFLKIFTLVGFLKIPLCMWTKPRINEGTLEKGTNSA